MFEKLQQKLKVRRIMRLNARYLKLAHRHQLLREVEIDPRDPLYEWFQDEVKNNYDKLRATALKLEKER